MAMPVAKRARLVPQILVALVSQIPMLVHSVNKQIQQAVGFSARLLSPHPRHLVITNLAALVIPALAAASLANNSNNRSQVDCSDPLPQQVQVVGCSGPPATPTLDSDQGVLGQGLGPEVVVSSGKATTSNSSSSSSSSNSRSHSLLDQLPLPQVVALEAERLASAIPTPMLEEAFLAHRPRRTATRLANKTTPSQRMPSVAGSASIIRTRIRIRINPEPATHLEDSANRIIKNRSQEGFLVTPLVTRMPVVDCLATLARTTTRAAEGSLVRPTINRTAAPYLVRSPRIAAAYSARVLQTITQPARICSEGLETMLMRTKIRRSSLKRVGYSGTTTTTTTTTNRSQEGFSVARLGMQVVVAFSATARLTTSNQAVAFSIWEVQINNSHPSLLEEVFLGEARELTTTLDPASLATLHSSSSKHLQTNSNPSKTCRLPFLTRIFMVVLQSSLAYLRPHRFLVQLPPRSTRRTSRRKPHFYLTIR